MSPFSIHSPLFWDIPEYGGLPMTTMTGVSRFTSSAPCCCRHDAAAGEREPGQEIHHGSRTLKPCSTSLIETLSVSETGRISGRMKAKLFMAG